MGSRNFVEGLWWGRGNRISKYKNTKYRYDNKTKKNRTGTKIGA